MRRTKVLIAAMAACALLIAAAVAWAAETVTINARFSPDKLGAPTNVSGNATFQSTSSPVPSPITKVTLMGPAGMGLDVTGTGTCTEATLTDRGPEACPKDSIAGAGGGRGAIELAGTIIREPFTVNLFRGPNEGGHVTVLLYVNAVSPVSVQLVFKAVVVKEPKPYGLGFSFVVPEIKTLPGASNASVESAFLTIGASKVVYYKSVKGHRRALHVKGVIVPKRCPKGGFPVEAQFSFEDGTTNTAKTTIHCPGK